MTNKWVVNPEEVKISLDWNGNKFWIKVKKRLSIGESRRMLKSISSVRSQLSKQVGANTNPEARFEWAEYSFARCEAFLLDWSLADENDSKMKISRENIEALEAEVFELIDNAIDEHETKSGTEKKRKNG